ncbi:MAG: type II toxin-antitoxin system PemK/MazF family toxin [Candidatus Taylorbacteria bacterium]|nr:type II toxin-antitoxin system PemK/MazF family toxin [Candidatus Taylorbacteria bacterium]
MQKDFSKWLVLKKSIHEVVGTALFHEREIWWCMLGANVGFEIDGGGEDFERPVIIVKKFNLDTCIVIPLTAKPKTGKYYFSVDIVDGRNAVAVLSQIRLIDRKRLVEKIETLSKTKFKELLNVIIKTNFTSR